MQPHLHPQSYRYIKLPGSPDRIDIEALAPLAVFHETEGYSAVVETQRARDAGLEGEGPFALITLQVHSSLSAIGLTAAVTSALARNGISANVIAAYHHDHVLLPAAEGAKAVAVLNALSALRAES